MEVGVDMDILLNSCTRGNGSVDLAVGLLVVGYAHLRMVIRYIVAVGVVVKR